MSPFRFHVIDAPSSNSMYLCGSPKMVAICTKDCRKEGLTNANSDNPQRYHVLAKMPHTVEFVVWLQQADGSQQRKALYLRRGRVHWLQNEWSNAQISNYYLGSGQTSCTASDSDFRGWIQYLICPADCIDWWRDIHLTLKKVNKLDLMKKRACPFQCQKNKSSHASATVKGPRKGEIDTVSVCNVILAGAVTRSRPLFNPEVMSNWISCWSMAALLLG